MGFEYISNTPSGILTENISLAHKSLYWILKLSHLFTQVLITGKGKALLAREVPFLQSKEEKRIDTPY